MLTKRNTSKQQALNAELLAGNRWAVNGGLRSPELILLQRALVFYCREYDAIKARSVTPHEKAQAQEYIDAADALSRRLRYNLVKLTDNEGESK